MKKRVDSWLQRLGQLTEEWPSYLPLRSKTNGISRKETVSP